MKMKKIPLLIFLVAVCTIMSCSKDESLENEIATEKFEARTKVYPLNAVSDADISGSVKFTEKEDGSTTVLITLTNSNNDVHPAHIHFNNATTTGPIAISLNPIECDCEESITEVTQMDNGTVITYDELITFNGYVNVHQSASDLETIIAQGNIGSNVD